MRVFATTLTTIVSGEISQLFTSHGSVSRADYYQRIHAKTASLFEAAAMTAAMISTDDSDIVTAAQSFGYGVGMAFQIVDDILDFTGDQVTVGKPVASDLRQGIITLPAIYYNELHPDDENMQAVLDGKFYNDSLMTQLVNSIRNSDVIEKSMNEARNFIEKVVDTISEFPISAERDALIDFAEYVVDRDI
jgi:geranylgeranyl pyrophosphate synthase